MHVTRFLALNGSVVLLYGLLLGAPYGKAIKRDAAGAIVHAWRVAHLSLPIGAILMLAVAALFASFPVAAPSAWFVAVTLTVSCWAFVVSLTLAPVTGERGLAAGAVGLARWVYLGNVTGAGCSVLAALGLIYALL